MSKRYPPIHPKCPHMLHGEAVEGSLTMDAYGVTILRSTES